MSERLVVLLSGEVAGYLDRPSPGEAPTFTYTSEYIVTGRVALSARLPLQRETHPAGRVVPYLLGLLPESDTVRAAWAGRLGVEARDAFGLLASMGWDCPGAVQFCREEALEQLHARHDELVPVDDGAIARRIRALAAGEASWTLEGEHWSLGGQQEKFALTLLEGRWFEAHGSAATTHIVKPGIRFLHHQALVEHATMAAASAVGVDVAGSSFSEFEDQWAIVVERFDRTVLDGQVIRIHQEDFAQACGREPERKYESRGGPGLSDLVRVVSRESTSPEDDRYALADHLAVNVVAGAPDGHAKNISMLRHPGLVVVAPLYDLATGLTYDAATVDRAVALSVGGERAVSRIRRRQWTKAAAVLGLDADLLVRRVTAMAEGFPGAFTDALAALPRSVPGVDEVAERTTPRIAAHAERVLDGL